MFVLQVYCYQRFVSAGRDRWPWPFDGPIGLYSRQIHLERQQGRRCQMRGHQHER